MWEYKVYCFEMVFWRNSKLMSRASSTESRINDKESEMEPWLNEMGKEGWELIHINDSMTKYFFKRKLTAKEVKKKTKIEKVEKA